MGAAAGVGAASPAAFPGAFGGLAAVGAALGVALTCDAAGAGVGTGAGATATAFEAGAISSGAPASAEAVLRGISGAGAGDGGASGGGDGGAAGGASATGVSATGGAGRTGFGALRSSAAGKIRSTWRVLEGRCHLYGQIDVSDARPATALGQSEGLRAARYLGERHRALRGKLPIQLHTGVVSVEARHVLLVGLLCLPHSVDAPLCHRFVEQAALIVGAWQELRRPLPARLRRDKQIVPPIGNLQREPGLLHDAERAEGELEHTIALKLAHLAHLGDYGGDDGAVD